MSATRAAAPRLRLLRSTNRTQRLIHSSSSYSTSSAAPSTSVSTSVSSSSASTTTNAPSSSSTKIISSLILSRPPIVLREPTKFEEAYHEYNRQLSEALQQPFPKDFYFKKGSAAEKRFEEDQAASSQGFSAIASAAGKGKDAKKGQASAAGASEGRTTGSAEGEDHKLLPKTTEADAKNDVRSLERKLDRTLYLVVKGKGGWKFPAKALMDTKHENLHDVAPKSVTEALGNQLDIWLVSNLPIGLYKPSDAEKTYFLKGHVMAGNAELNKGEVEEFQWLTKEEIEELMNKSKGEAYWKRVEDLLDP
ncbi:uncharacterized protein UHO2_06196 [Ustilago hordei]|uniref:Large ribosomal subunit protein mL46 n=1 Tax=Ustilago hordei TaxID=120017 RepID=I2FTR5_USTHO|nr:uncharacterized protein UHO2_06196 [Ustilago hordei]CCF50308.1 related to MRPL17-mitochondrial ribosomal protein, large subunit [Ustilago hordei]SYW86979.1 related to MRPL17 - mitochondrial ribosomal protein, large subunit [Ustilago hordei]